MNNCQICGADKWVTDLHFMTIKEGDLFRITQVLVCSGCYDMYGELTFQQLPKFIGDMILIGEL